MNIIIVNMSYFKNILLFECQPPLEKFLYPPLSTNANTPQPRFFVLHKRFNYIYSMINYNN